MASWHCLARFSGLSTSGLADAVAPGGAGSGGFGSCAGVSVAGCVPASVVSWERTLIFCALMLGGGGESEKCLVPFASVHE